MSSVDSLVMNFGRQKERERRRRVGLEWRLEVSQWSRENALNISYPNKVIGKSITPLSKIFRAGTRDRSLLPEYKRTFESDKPLIKGNVQG